MLFVFWRRGVSRQATDAMFEVMDALVEARPSIGVLVTVYDGIDLPQQDVQAAISEGLLARTKKLGHGVAIAVEGSGIGATLGRSIARTISLFSRQGYPSKVHPNPSAGLAWLRRQGADAVADITTYQVIRAQVDALPS